MWKSKTTKKKEKIEKLEVDQKLHDTMLQNLRDQQKEIEKATALAFASSQTTNNSSVIPSNASGGANWLYQPSTFTIPAAQINPLPGQFIKYNDPNILKELYDIQIAPENHLTVLEKKEGFKWLDKDKTWALCPDHKNTDELYKLLQYTQYKNATISPPKEQSISSYTLFHRHDNDCLYKQFQLNERYHGAHSYICKECHKPPPDEYKMLYVLQSSLKNAK